MGRGEIEKGERKEWVGGAVLRFLSTWALGLASARLLVASSLGLSDLAHRIARVLVCGWVWGEGMGLLGCWTGW